MLSAISCMSVAVLLSWSTCKSVTQQHPKHRKATATLGLLAMAGPSQAHTVGLSSSSSSSSWLLFLLLAALALLFNVAFSKCETVHLTFIHRLG